MKRALSMLLALLLWSSVVWSYTIYGQVRRFDLPGIYNATVILAATGATTTTDVNGYYSLYVEPGTTSAIYARKAGYSFSPGKYDVVNVSSDLTLNDFIGYERPVPITGYVYMGSAPVDDATLTFSHNGATVTTYASGYYYYAVDGATTTTITPSLAGIASWDPPSRLLEYLIWPANDQNFTGTPATYTISGTITDGAGPVPDVTLTFSHDGLTSTTLADGTYSYPISGRSTTTITPSKTGYHFDPPSRTCSTIISDQPGQDFTAILNTYIISGRVSDGVNPVQGAQLSFTHDPAANITTNANGEYACSITHGASTTISVSHPGYQSWTPATRSLTTVSADQQNQNFVGTPKEYTISGQITDAASASSIEGATIHFSHTSATTTTDASGKYSFKVLYGTTTTVSVTHPAYHGWSPANRPLSNIANDQNNQDFTGILNTFTISGVIGDGSQPLAGATVIFSHNGGTTTSNANGEYACVVNYGTTTTLTPSHPSYSIWEPPDITLNNITADQPHQDFNAQPSRFVVALQFTDAAGAAVGGVLCRLWAPDRYVGKVQSAAVMQLLWGAHPYNALFRYWDAMPGGDYLFRFTAPPGWAFLSPDSMVLEVPAAANFYSIEGHRFILRQTGTTPAPDDSGAVVPPQPPEWHHPLQFVSGSPEWHSQPWENAVDEDVEGWDGTATVQVDESGKTWAIFKFSNEQIHKFNYFTLQTDNGTDDDLCVNRQPYQVEVSTSTTGADPIDFTSLGVFRIKSPQMSFYKIGKVVAAKYVLLRIFTVPGARHGWEQVVEFGLSWNKTQDAQPVAEAMAFQVMPDGFALEPAHPNPFNPETTIRYQLPEEAYVVLRVFNLAGQEVARLADGQETAGAHAVRWQAGHLPSGVYVIILSAGEHKTVQRVALVK